MTCLPPSLRGIEPRPSPQNQAPAFHTPLLQGAWKHDTYFLSPPPTLWFGRPELTAFVRAVLQAPRNALSQPCPWLSSTHQVAPGPQHTRVCGRLEEAPWKLASRWIGGGSQAEGHPGAGGLSAGSLQVSLGRGDSWGSWGQHRTLPWNAGGVLCVCTHECACVVTNMYVCTCKQVCTRV